MSEDEKALTDAYYWLSMYKSGAITEGVAMEKVKEAMLKQPQLNDNQQIVLEWLKSETILTREAPILSVNAFSDKNLLGKLPDKVRKAYKLLACKQEYEVLAAFTQWGLEQEEAE